jgi:hypothetical protein
VKGYTITERVIIKGRILRHVRDDQTAWLIPHDRMHM